MEQVRQFSSLLFGGPSEDFPSPPGELKVKLVTKFSNDVEACGIVAFFTMEVNDECLFRNETVGPRFHAP